MSLNEEQQAYMKELADMKPEDKCGCGWYSRKECRHICPPKSPSQRPDDKLYMTAYQEGKEDFRKSVDNHIEHMIQKHKKCMEEYRNASNETLTKHHYYMFGYLIDLKSDVRKLY